MTFVFFYQLQTFERRARFLRKGRETKRWNSISPEMMSDEEKRGSVYIRHQPEYRSETFNLFMNKLDERSCKQGSVHARFQREIGSPVKLPVPVGIKTWMLKKEYQTVDNEHSQTVTLETQESESNQMRSIESSEDEQSEPLFDSGSDDED